MSEQWTHPKGCVDRFRPASFCPEEESRLLPDLTREPKCKMGYASVRVKGGPVWP